VPSLWQKRLEKWWPKNRRIVHFRIASVVALLLASFLAYDDVSQRYRQAEIDLATERGLKKAAIDERDQARRQYIGLIDSMHNEDKTGSITLPSSLTLLAPSTPAWLKTAYKELGVKEIPGPEENPRIVEYFKSIGAKDYRDDLDDWASAFVEWSLNQSQIHGPKDDDPFAWLVWGKSLETPIVGCIVVLSFSGLHHVGFYFSGDGDFIRVLGGNESDAVNIFRYPKTAVFGYRWPPDVPLPNH